MSHRVTTKTEMKDVSIVEAVCKNQRIAFERRGDTIYFQSGDLRNATLNLRTGDITGDTDFGHTEGVLGVLRQAYGEAKYTQEAVRQGITIQSRSVDNQGRVILRCHMA